MVIVRRMYQYSGGNGKKKESCNKFMLQLHVSRNKVLRNMPSNSKNSNIQDLA